MSDEVKDQPAAESKKDQPEDNPSEREQPKDSPEDELVVIDNESVRLSELKQGYLRNKDYTQKTQEVAEMKKELEGKARELARADKPQLSTSEETDPEIAKAINLLKEHGMATKDDLQALEARQLDDKKLTKLIETNPDLKKHEQALRVIGKTDNRAWEDLVVKYGFKASDKLAKAKANVEIVGEPAAKTKEQSKKVKDLTTKEYGEWKKANLRSGGWASN